MKKLFLSLFVATALVSCNRDNDDPTTEQDAPLPVKFISYDHESKNDNTPESTTNLEYDGNKLLKITNISNENGNSITTLKYQGNLISSIKESYNNNLTTTSFKYDTNGNLIEEVKNEVNNDSKSETVIKYAVNNNSVTMTSEAKYYDSNNNQPTIIENENYVLTLNANKQTIKKEGTRNRTYFDYNGDPIVDTKFSTDTYTYDGKNAILKNVAGMKNLSYSEFLLDGHVNAHENLLNKKSKEANNNYEFEHKFEYNYNKHNYPTSFSIFYKYDNNIGFIKSSTIKIEYNK